MKVGNSVKIRESNCLSCGYLLDAATPVEIDHPPSSGDVTICIACGHIMAFGDELELRELTNEEIKDIAGNPVVLAIQKAREQL